MIADVQEPRSTETGPVRGDAHTGDHRREKDKNPAAMGNWE